MAEKYGSFKDLSNGKKPITAEEAWIMLKELGLLGQEFVPGATSVRKLMEGDVKGAGSELNDWIPGGKAVQNLAEGKDQDWAKNALDLAIVGKPLVKGAKKAAEAIERMPKGGKEGFIVLKKNQGDNKLKDVIEASNEAGQTITPEIEKEIRDHIGLTNDLKRNPSMRAQARQIAHYDNMSVEARQVIDAYLGQEQIHSPKPAGFDALPATERKAILEQNFREMGADPNELLERSKALKDQNYEGHYDYGVIYPDQASLDDYAKAVWDVEHEPKPISITQVMGDSYNKVPVQKAAVENSRGSNNTYDHSRNFLDTEFKQVPAIDRSGNKYTDPQDTKYDIYETWKNVIDKPNYDKHPVLKRLAESKAIEDLDKTRKWYGNANRLSITHNDPYYSAGVVGDENVKLWDLINTYRAAGKTDDEIRKILKKSLDNYQGKLDRYKARMEMQGGNFEYDGALTPTFTRTPSERAAAYNALGIDTPEYEKLQEMRDFYKGITKRVFDYENKFPQTPKLTSNQFKQLKDMGIKPEEIDQYLAEHPEFLLAVE